MKSFWIVGVVLLLSAVELEATYVSQFACQKRDLTLTTDNHLILYIDGVEITGLPNYGDFRYPDVVDLPCTTKLIAIHGINGGDVSFNVAGILASTGDEYVLTNTTWKCLNVSQVGWEQIDFDDSAWVTPIEYGHNGEGAWGLIPGISTNAAWIWLRQFTYEYQEAGMDMDVYCRKRLAPSYCLSNPCVFGGTCVDEPDGGYCICVPGYTGQDCSAVINYCLSDPCVNGASCLPIINGYVCQCQPGYAGDNCEFIINNCASLPCLNGGTCLNGINYYGCECPPEWTGVICDTLVNPCADYACANGGTCLNNCGVAQCICVPGYTGTLCIDHTEACASNPCVNGGSCEEVPDGWTCTCPPSLTGLYCEQIIDLCASSPCQSGGTCVFDCGDYRCYCPAGWTGLNCQTLIDPCDPNPCLNGGTCNDLGGAEFTCTCPIYWTGVNCESANYNESLACGTTLDWANYDAVNGFTRLCYFWAPSEDIEGRHTECRYTINGIPLYDDYVGLMQAGGNFGCVVGHDYPEDLPITSRAACDDNYQQDVSLANYTETARLMVCIRYPYEGVPGTK